jgi:hypothetical protein
VKFSRFCAENKTPRLQSITPRVRSMSFQQYNNKRYDVSINTGQYTMPPQHTRHALLTKAEAPESKNGKAAAPLPARTFLHGKQFPSTTPETRQYRRMVVKKTDIRAEIEEARMPFRSGAPLSPRCQKHKSRVRLLHQLTASQE